MRAAATLAILALLTFGVSLVGSAQTVTPGITNPTESTPVDLYFHLVGFQQFPINTQVPEADYSAEVELGATGGTSSCLPATPYTGASFHTMRGFSSPGYVEYGFIENGGPRYHPERGLSYDVLLDPENPPVLTWYVSTALPPIDGIPRDDTLPVIVPNFIVEARIQTGEDITIGPGADLIGDIIASGQSEPAILAREQTSGAVWTKVDGKDVYEVKVPLAIAADPIIAKAAGYKLWLRMRMDVPAAACNPAEGGLMPNLVRIHTSPEHRPRLSLHIMDPVRIEYLHPQFLGDQLYIHATANSPFGNYDVDEAVAAIAVGIQGPSPAPSLRLENLTQHTHVHDRHTEAVDLAFTWDFSKDAAAAGDYSVTLAVKNDQHTAEARALGQFTLGKDLTVTRCGATDSVDTAASERGCTKERQDAQGNVLSGDKKSPGGAVLGALMAVAAALLLARQGRAGNG